MNRTPRKWNPPAAFGGSRQFDPVAPIRSRFQLPRILPDNVSGWWG